jgi:hypothetical protein
MTTGEAQVAHKQLQEKLLRDSTGNGDTRYLVLLDEMRALHIKKSADYGAGEDALANLRGSENIGIPAWLGAWIRAKDKVHRIDAFAKKRELANESVEDSLMDLAAYSLLTIILLREATKP